MKGENGFDREPRRRAGGDHTKVPVIPAETHRVNPETLIKLTDQERNRIERLFAKGKEFRQIATRYDKRQRRFFG